MQNNTIHRFSWGALAMSVIALTPACQSGGNADKPAADSTTVKLITLNPGHFHAALVQKTGNPNIDSVVHVYAPGGPELDAHLALINQYNARPENPTHWKEEVYTGADYLDKMIAEKKGNVVVLAGNNQQKTAHIKKAVEAGINVLGDKPMAIDAANFSLLEQAFADAAAKKVLLYDIMTERSEITNTLQRELAHMPSVFGQQQAGTEKDPGVVIESVHYFYKFVSGKALTRPSWFFDPTQQGEAIADVGTHLIDLVQWECFPDSIIDYKKDIQVTSARIWPTAVTLSQFTAVTKKDSFPDFLRAYVEKDSVLQTHANGEANYTLKGIHVKMIARWDYKAPEGSGDTHYSLLRGSLAQLEIRQGAEEKYQPTLYILPAKNDAAYEQSLQQAVAGLQARYAGVAIEKTAKGYKLAIPQSFKTGHEAHFGEVMQRFLQYLKEGKLPNWEVPGMLAKYYTATRALEVATNKK
ncbi:putative oxidoreductase C-terminal domain-containing protein [Paraflavitalea sp. CAU 1676]|uniref:putative oxidoreductase C-terminal domain-containing protein n=1 Tax=Paraflavitalea sp. CAU 1676 TaxID=3032598 RepID=UPI0023DB2A52|nr:putative oxidoreductase C-terminal domain-containing protein [Paraflavitalea sp. CAU 1676]MDF2192915.1 putative oxidoreductase C-terminal domain-containing protein [Paraflavitalea sp. CAU 1676]